MHPPACFDLAPAEVHVWIMSSHPSPALVAQLKALLSPDERDRASRFGPEQSQRDFVIARGVLRQFLGRYLKADPAGLRFSYGPQGKPFIEGTGLGFSMTRSSGLVACAFAWDCHVGIDVERMQAGISIVEIASRFFPPEKAAKIVALPPAEREPAFFRLWTRQEAYSKATGEGLTGMRKKADASWTLRDLPVPPGFVGALTYSGKQRAIKIQNYKFGESSIDLTPALGKNVGRHKPGFSWRQSEGTMADETNANDWSASYSQYLARSAALSARTLNLYQLALERVSQGKLPPTIFQDHFPAFAVAHAAEFTNRFSEVGSRFLSDLVRLGSSFSQQQQPPPAAADPILPQFDSSNPARWYEQLAEYAGEVNARAIKSYRSQLDRVASGETTPSEVQQQTAEQMAQGLPEQMQLISRIYFDLLNGLNDVRSAYEETYFRGLLAKAESPDSEAKVTLALAGNAGATASASLSVINTTGQRTQIGHRIADVRRVDGTGPSLVPSLKFVPETLELGPEEEGLLTVALHLDPAVYDPDALYSGALYLTGGSDVPLEVDLRILATVDSSGRANAQGAR